MFSLCKATFVVLLLAGMELIFFLVAGTSQNQDTTLGGRLKPNSLQVEKGG